jgi:hypothetical protein
VTADNLHFAPPDDLRFQSLLLRASRGQIPVYGAVIETAKVRIVRAFESHRPETMEGGPEVVQQMFRAWQAGQPAQPWLYVNDGCYIVADDYFWLALIEKGKPTSFAAQVLGEPLDDGLIQKVGPLGPGFIHDRFGKL